MVYRFSSGYAGGLFCLWQGLVEFHPSFSRHAKAKASFALVIWLNENVPAAPEVYFAFAEIYKPILPRKIIKPFLKTKKLNLLRSKN